MRAFHAIFLLLPLSCLGATITEDFTTLTQWDAANSTAVWNVTLQRAHPPFIVDRANDGVIAENDAVPLGAGTSGGFESSAYLRLDVNGGASPGVVTLSSDRVYEFTTFTLDRGTTLRATGTGPLRIRVLGAAVINGDIDLNGRAGEGVASITSTRPAGGSAGSGGSPGGDGGAAGVAAADGTSNDASDTGRGRAGVSGTAGGGGGGAGHGADGIAGSQAGGGGAGGARGDAYDDAFITGFFGGSGGGGGGASSSGTTGGGGGGGGGVLFLTVGGGVRMGSSARILARGGAGGGSSSTLAAGTGGGGSGGAVVIFTAGAFTNDGEVNATGASGGLGGNGGLGGAGGDGRTRIVTFTGFLSGSGTETPAPALVDQGRVYYSLAPCTLVSKSYDSRNSAPGYRAVRLEGSTTGSQVTVELAASRDNFVNDVSGVGDNPGFVPEARFSELAGRRYFKFRLTMTAGSRADTLELSRVHVDTDDHVAQTFDFKIAGCARVAMNPPGPLGVSLLVAWLLALPALTRRL